MSHRALVQWCHHYSAEVYVCAAISAMSPVQVTCHAVSDSHAVQLILQLIFFISNNSVVTGPNRDHQIFVWQNGERRKILMFDNIWHFQPRWPD